MVICKDNRITALYIFLVGGKILIFSFLFRVLEAEHGITCNLTLLFCFAQVGILVLVALSGTRIP